MGRTTGIGFLHSPSLQRAPSNPPALGLGFDAWGHSRETRELAGAVGEGATPCTDGRPSENTPPWLGLHQSSLPNAAKGYPPREPRERYARPVFSRAVHTCTSRILEGRSGTRGDGSGERIATRRGAGQGSPTRQGPRDTERKKENRHAKRGMGRGQGPHLHEQDFGRTIRGTGGALLLLTRDTTGSQRGARWTPTSTGGLISV